MNYLNKNKLFFWIGVLLLGINLTVLSIYVYNIFIHKDPREKPPRENEFEKDKKHGDVLLEELQFTDTQTTQYELFRQKYDKELEMINAKLDVKREAMLNLLAAEKPDTLQLNNLAEETGKLLSQIKKITISKILNLKDLCNKEQQSKLQMMFKELLKSDEHFCKNKDQHKNHFHEEMEGKKPRP